MKKIIIFVALKSELEHFEHPNVEIHYTGVGKVNAAIKATQVISQIDNNSLVINYGSAGSNSLPNEIFKCTKFTQADMDARPLELIGVTPFDNIIYPEIPPVIEFEFEGYICHTYDCFQNNPKDQIVDMEAYAIAKVCKIYKRNFISYKYISDSGDSNEWKNNHMNGADLFLNILKNDYLNTL